MEQSVYCHESSKTQKRIIVNYYRPNNADKKSGTHGIGSNTIYIEEGYNKLMTELTQEFSSVRVLPFFASISTYRRVGSPSQKAQIQKIYNELLNNFMYLYQKDINLLKMFPPVHSYIYDEGTIGIEWNLNKLIVAFDIEDNPDDSCWTISSVQSAGDYSEGDYFSKKNPIDSVVQYISRLIIQQLDHLL